MLTGTEVYARRIIESLAEQRKDRRIRVYANAASAPAWLPEGAEWRGIPFPRLWTHWRLRQALRRDRPNVTFIPSHVLPFLLGLPSVVTIHDVGHRREARSYSRSAWAYLELTTRYAVRRATHLIAVSQSTADDLQRFYRVPPQQLTVIHSGIDERFTPPTDERITELRSRLGLDQPYFLFVGRNHPRKNLPLLRQAFLEARSLGMRATLALTGPDHSPASGGQGIVILPYVPSEDLAPLYAGSIALLLPSRFEGFGFPALEAMRSGTAVIAARTGSLPEIIGSAGILLNPDDASAWSRSMVELADDPARRRRLVDAGLGRSQEFTWESAGAKTWQVLDAAAGRA